PCPTLFPYTTLFRSDLAAQARRRGPGGPVVQAPSAGRARSGEWGCLGGRPGLALLRGLHALGRSAGPAFPVGRDRPETWGRPRGGPGPVARTRLREPGRPAVWGCLWMRGRPGGQMRLGGVERSRPPRGRPGGPVGAVWRVA